MIWQMEPQRGESHSPQDGVTGSAGPVVRGGLKKGQMSVYPRQVRQADLWPPTLLCSLLWPFSFPLVASPNTTQHLSWSFASMFHP